MNGQTIVTLALLVYGLPLSLLIATAVVLERFAGISEPMLIVLSLASLVAGFRLTNFLGRRWPHLSDVSVVSLVALPR